MIKFLKKGLNNFKEEISDDPQTFFVIMCSMMTIVAIVAMAWHAEPSTGHEQTIREYYDSGKAFATDKITVTDKYFAKTSNGKGVQKCLTVKFNGRSYCISDSKLYDKVKKGDKLKGYYVYDYIWGSYCKVLYLAEGKHVRMQEGYK